MTPQEAAQTGHGGRRNGLLPARNRPLCADNNSLSTRTGALRLRNEALSIRNGQGSPRTGLVRPGNGALSVRNGWLPPGTPITADFVPAPLICHKYNFASSFP